MENVKFLFNAGQGRAYKEGEKPVQFEKVPYKKAPVLDNVPELQIHPSFADRNYVVTSDVTEFIAGVTADMCDWWWGNLEKGYDVWAPGEHYGFDWLVPPCEVGYEGSVESSYEFDPHHPLVLTRLNMKEFPFTECYGHCWISGCMLGPVQTYLVHMYEDTEGGILWRSVQFMTRENASVMASMRDQMPDLASHMEYESGRLNVVLPPLYQLWSNHPDPWQNIRFDLSTEKNEDGTWRHKYKNLPPKKNDDGTWHHVEQRNIAS